MTQEKTNDPNRASLREALAAATRASQSGRLGEAEGLLRQILRDYPNQPDALHLLGLVAHQTGHTETGIQLIERALLVSPHVAGFHANLAELYRRTGNREKAIEHGERAIALKADNADAHFNLGLAHFDNRDYARAISYFDEAIRLQPPNAPAIHGRANALRQLGRYGEAEADYRRALAIKPSYPEAWNNFGTALRDLERADEAVVAYRKALALRPEDIGVLNNLILAHKDLRQFDEAVAVANEALRLAPRNPETLARLAAVHLDRRDPRTAIAVLELLLATSPAKAETYDMLGRAYFQTNDVEMALTAYRKAVELKPDFAAAHANMGNAAKELGRFEAALASFEKALDLDPAQSDVYLDAADIRTFKPGDRHLAAIEALLARDAALPTPRRMRLQFAAAKAYDDLERYDEAFAHLLSANASQRQRVAYDEVEALALFERIKSVATSDLLRAKAGGGAVSAQPIFVIGMPRSGTTLIEQILARHPRVRTAGETDDFPAAAGSVRDSDGTSAPYPESLRILSPAELAALGERYVRLLDRHAAGAERIVDKLPSNFYFAGLIHLALPNARIVHVNRNALDTCVSCFSKLFVEGWGQTYDLGELGRYYRAYDGLMQHWRAVLPAGAMLEMQYETVVGDLEGEARRLLDYCGLEWDPAVLEFYANARAVKSASAVQVRRPIYASAIGRWQNYKPHLGSLVAELANLP